MTYGLAHAILMAQQQTKTNWPGCDIPSDLRQKYSVAWLDDGTDSRIPEDAMECPGNCETCGACWGLAKRGIDVRFAKH